MILSYFAPKLSDTKGMFPAANVNTRHFLASSSPQNVVKFYKSRFLDAEFMKSASLVTDRVIVNYTLKTIDSPKIH